MVSNEEGGVAGDEQQLLGAKPLPKTNVVFSTKSLENFEEGCSSKERGISASQTRQINCFSCVTL